jgi:hypothetical protein
MQHSDMEKDGMMENRAIESRIVPLNQELARREEEEAEAPPVGPFAEELATLIGPNPRLPVERILGNPDAAAAAEWQENNGFRREDGNAFRFKPSAYAPREPAEEEGGGGRIWVVPPGEGIPFGSTPEINAVIEQQSRRQREDNKSYNEFVSKLSREKFMDRPKGTWKTYGGKVKAWQVSTQCQKTVC